MSDDTTKYLNTRISELERSLAEANADAKRRRLEAKKLKEDNATFQAAYEEIDGKYKSLTAASGTSTDEWKAKYDELAGQVRQRTHKDAFAKLAGELKVRPDAIDDLFALSGYKAEGDAIDETKLKGLIGEAVKARPYLLHDGPEKGQAAAGAAPKPKLSLEGGPGGRGDRDTQATSRVTYRKEDLQQPGWQAKNPALVEAFRAGTAVLTD